MLYRFSVENYKSFRDRNEISFIPVSENDDRKVLQTSVIYGANASGKSNFIKAIDFAQDFILDNSCLVEVDNLAYKLEKEYIQKPSVFSFEILVDEVLYQYGFAVSFKDSMVLEEWLFSIAKGEENEFFSRTYDEDNDIYEIDLRYESGIENAERYQIYSNDLQKNKVALILTELAKKPIGQDSLKKAIDTVFDWFRKLVVIFPTSKYNLLGAVAKDQETANELYKSYFKIFNIDIEDIHLKEIDKSYLSIPDDVIKAIKADLIKNKQEIKEEAMAMLHGVKQDYLVKLDDNGELCFLEVRFTHRHNNYAVEMDKEEESDGTQRLFDLIPMLGNVLKEDRTIIIDEIDRSLHTLIVRKFFELFVRNVGDRKSQLICTTHDVLLLDTALLDKSEIWIIQKKAGRSSVFCMDKFKFPNNHSNLMENYLLGRMGGVPLL